MDKKKILFTRDDRKNISHQIENLKNDDDYIAIFDILMNDESADVICITNKNGACFNLSVVSDKTFIEIREYLNKVENNRNKKDAKPSVIPINNIQKERAHKLSNYEQNLLRHREIRQAQDDNTVYKELEFSSKELKISELDPVNQSSKKSKRSSLMKEKTEKSKRSSLTKEKMKRSKSNNDAPKRQSKKSIK